jgi:uncharacterized glyoxalase superfamily protein PhnB
MSISISNDIRAVVPIMPYRNTIEMVDWLCDAFGFQRQVIVKGEDKKIKHAELTFGECMIMVVGVQDSPFEKLVVHPDQIGGVETQTCYLVVADVEAHFARAKAKGAEIIFAVRVENHGGRGYACRDPEGHMWMFGTYDPRRGLFPRRDPDRGTPRRPAFLLPLLLSILTLASAAVAVLGYSEMRWTTLVLDRIIGLSGARPSAGPDRLVQDESPARQAREWDAKSLATKLIEVQAAKEKAEQKAKDLAARLAQERQARESAVQRGKEVQELLTRELRASEGYSQAAKQAKDQLSQERFARVAAEKVAKDAADQLNSARFAKAVADAKQATEKCEQERTWRSLAERTAQDAMDHLTRERNARAVAELAANELRNQLASFSPEPQEQISELRNRIEAEHRAKDFVERAAKDIQQQLAQEKHSRDSAERALRQTQQKLTQLTPSCWSCPTAAPCERQ